MRDNVIPSRRALLVGAVVACVAVVGSGWLLHDQGPAGRAASRTPAAAGTPSVSRTPKASAPPSAAGTPSTSGTPRVSGAQPGPAGAAVATDAAAGFLTELDAIDPGLAADRDRALRAGQSTCQDIHAMPYAEVVRGAIQRFRAVNVPVDQVKATLIVDAVVNNLCPT
jgi:hypothetical protein